MIPRTADGRLGEPTPVILDSHRAGLTLVGWTFRGRTPSSQPSSAEVPTRRSGRPGGRDRTFLPAGMDQFFTDNHGNDVQAVF